MVSHTKTIDHLHGSRPKRAASDGFGRILVGTIHDQGGGGTRVVFGAVFGRGDAAVGDNGWLQAMLDAEAGLARALERAGLVPAGAGQAVTAAANAQDFDPATFGTELTGNPVPGLGRARARRLPAAAAAAVHRGATSQDIIDTAMMLLASRVIAATLDDLDRAAGATARLAVQYRGAIMIGRTLL